MMGGNGSKKQRNGRWILVDVVVVVIHITRKWRLGGWCGVEDGGGLRLVREC